MRSFRTLLPLGLLQGKTGLAGLLPGSSMMASCLFPGLAETFGSKIVALINLHMELTLSGSLCPVVMLLAFPNKTLTTSLTWLLKVLCSRGDCPGQTFAVASHSILLVGLDVTFKRSQRKASYFLQNASRDSRAYLQKKVHPLQKI